MELPEVDLSLIESMRDMREEGGEDPLGELIDMYLRDCPLHIDSIEKAHQAEDPAALKLASHSLKGSSSNLGMLPLAKIASLIEEAAKAGDLEPVPGLLGALKQCFQEIVVILEREKA